MKILRHVGDQLQDLLLGTVEIVLDVQNLLNQVAEPISSRKIEMKITERRLKAGVQNLHDQIAEEIGTKKIGVLHLLEVIGTKKIVKMINTGMRGVQDRLYPVAEMINIGMKGAQDHLDLVDAQDLLAILHESARVHLHTLETRRAADMVKKRGGLVLQSNLDQEETVTLGKILSPTSALEFLA